MIAPTFHSSILKSFVPVFNKKSRHVINKLRKEIGKEFDVHDYMSGITVDILLGKYPCRNETQNLHKSFCFRNCNGDNEER